MNDSIKKAEYSRSLQDRKKALLKKVKEIEIKQYDNAEDCEHISVVQNAPRIFPYHGYQYRCLLCERHLGQKTSLFIDATHYLEGLYNDFNPKEIDEKFYDIKTVALDIWREDPSMSPQEFVDHFNSLIRRSQNQNRAGRQLKKAGK